MGDQASFIATIEGAGRTCRSPFSVWVSPGKNSGISPNRLSVPEEVAVAMGPHVMRQVRITFQVMTEEDLRADHLEALASLMTPEHREENDDE